MICKANISYTFLNVTTLCKIFTEFYALRVSAQSRVSRGSGPVLTTIKGDPKGEQLKKDPILSKDLCSVKGNQKSLPCVCAGPETMNTNQGADKVEDEQEKKNYIQNDVTLLFVS